MLSLHRVDITQMLRKLVAEGFLQSEGIGRGTHYLPKINFGRESDGNSIHSEGDSLRLGGDLENNYLHLEGNSEHLGGNSRQWDVKDLVRQVRQKKRTSNHLVRQAILALCLRDYLTLKEISDHLDRSFNALRRNQVSPMVKEGLLILEYPDNPNHPNQKYKTRDDA